MYNGIYRKSRYLVPALAMLGLLVLRHFSPVASEPVKPLPAERVSGVSLQAAYAARRSGTWIETHGKVTQLLPDDTSGSRHQRLILDVGQGRTLLVVHNIDLAPRIPASVGDMILARGRYEWNDKGGMIHWTHHDPQQREAGGWIRCHGKLYR